jgi:hypothetical protein
MEKEKEHYLEHLRKILKESYVTLKKTRSIPNDKKHFIEGYMTAGRIFGLNFKDLQSVMEETNYEIFKMSIDKRKEIYKDKSQPDTEDLEIPTWTRWGKEIKT